MGRLFLMTLILRREQVQSRPMGLAMIITSAGSSIPTLQAFDLPEQQVLKLGSACARPGLSPEATTCRVVLPQEPTPYVAALMVQVQISRPDGMAGLVFLLVRSRVAIRSLTQTGGAQELPNTSYPLLPQEQFRPYCPKTSAIQTPGAPLGILRRAQLQSLPPALMVIITIEDSLNDTRSSFLMFLRLQGLFVVSGAETPLPWPFCRETMFVSVLPQEVILYEEALVVKVQSPVLVRTRAGLFDPLRLSGPNIQAAPHEMLPKYFTNNVVVVRNNTTCPAPTLGTHPP